MDQEASQELGFIDDQIVLLIEQVKKNPALYAKKSKAYINTGLKDRTWTLIGNELAVTVEEVKKRWKNLRDRYMKELRKTEQTSASGAGTSQVYVSKWCYFQELSFLAEHCERRRTTSNFPSNSEHVNTEEEIQSGQGDFTNLEFLEEVLDVEDPKDQPVERTPNPTKRKRQDLDNRFSELLDAVGEVVGSSMTKKSRHDAFCRFLTEKMELLPANMARELELEFINRVNNLLDELESQ